MDWIVMARRVVAVFAAVVILVVSFFAWFFIELSFDGCCGAPPNSANNTLQGLTHIGAYSVAIGLLWLVLWWGWKRPKPNKR